MDGIKQEQKAEEQLRPEGNDLKSELQGEGKQLPDQAANISKHIASLPRNNPVGKMAMPWWLLILVVVLSVGSGVVSAYLMRPKQHDIIKLSVDVATLYLANGQTDAAIRVLDSVMQTGITEAETLNMVGEDYRQLKEYDKAIILLTQAVAKDPNNPDYIHNLARAYSSGGKTNEAIAQYRKLISLVNPKIDYYLFAELQSMATLIQETNFY
jgi:tetratricopeptide (TPR) repeat protein